METNESYGMKLVVFGATGGTGRQVVVQALEEGHEVTAVVRRPEVFDLRHDKLEVVEGDVLLPTTLRQAMCEKDAALSALGVSHRNPTTVYSAGRQISWRRCRRQLYAAAAAAGHPGRHSADV